MKVDAPTNFHTVTLFLLILSHNYFISQNCKKIKIKIKLLKLITLKHNSLSNLRYSEIVDWLWYAVNGSAAYIAVVVIV